jgi:hypothetical protein
MGMMDDNKKHLITIHMADWSHTLSTEDVESTLREIVHDSDSSGGFYLIPKSEGDEEEFLINVSQIIRIGIEERE